MKIIESFFSDWHNILRSRLTTKGINIKGLTDNAVVSTYFNLQKRLIIAKPRNIKRSNSFFIHPQFKNALSDIESVICLGGDLTPYLSRQISKLSKTDRVDKLLSDWGIHHFHLKKEGTKELLFAMVDDENFYEIGIFDHDSWCDTEMLKVIHDNWPKLIEKFKFKNKVIFNYNSKIAKLVRESNILTPIQIDGEAYLPFGGGLTTSGNSVEAEITADLERYKIVDIIKRLKSFTRIPSFVRNDVVVKCWFVDDSDKIYIKSIFFEEETDLM